MPSRRKSEALLLKAFRHKKSCRMGPMARKESQSSESKAPCCSRTYAAKDAAEIVKRL